MGEATAIRAARLPERIVCMTEETTETLYLLGEEDRIVGISGYTVRPQRARREKPRVTAFTTAKIERVLALEPDLVLGFSDLQADLAAALVRAGVQVHVFNQRSLPGILDMILTLGALVGAQERARALTERYREQLDAARRAQASLPRRPRVYFEEWDDPMIAAIRWVSELVEIAGGVDCFPELARAGSGGERIIADPGEVVRRAPDIIIGSWCGKKFRPEQVRARPGWEAVPAVRHDHLYEIKSANILAPGPAALDDGLHELRRIIGRWCEEPESRRTS